MIILFLFALIVPYYSSIKINENIEKHLEYLLVNVFYQNIFYKDDEVLLNEKNIKDIMIYYLKNLLSNYHGISSIKVGFYFENLKMQCSLNYLNYAFSFQITKEVYYE